jgi:5'-nucleotidase
MRILVTNDDGIHAPGLKSLEHIARELGGDEAEIWVVAPASEKSGVGHCISYTTPMMFDQRGERRFAVDGNPADCVLAGLHHIMGDTRPDIILSGVNRGNNSAENALYSGTLGAAMEGALQGIPSFALSQFLGPKNYSIDNPFEASEKYGAEVLRKILDKSPEDDAPYCLFYNINFPPCPASEVNGTRVTAQGRRPNVNFTTEHHKSGNGRDFLFVRGGAQHVDTAPDTDAAVNLDGYISVTPMRADLTDYSTLEALGEL